MKNNLMVSVVLIFTTTNMFSQQGEKIKDSITIEEVVVTGSPVKVNKNNVPMAVSVVSREQIQESKESALLPILNGRIPGLFVTERGVTGFGVSTGAAGQITMRGIGGNPTTGVLILIDGHPQFMGIFGHPLADSYVASDVEKVEVIRGPASILYGSNAMGGVINIITRKQIEDGLHGNASILYGSYNTQKYMVNGGLKNKGVSIFASVNHDQTDGFRSNSDFQINNGYVKLGYNLAKNIKASSDLSIAHFHTTDPGPDTVNAKTGNNLNVTRGYWSFSIDNDYKILSGAMKIFYNFGEHKISDGFHSTDANYGLNIHESVKLFKRNSLTFGGDYLNYGGKAENELALGGNGVIFKDTTVREVGIYGFIQQSFLKKITFNAGLRLQNHSVYGKEWIPSGGLAFRMTAITTWKLSVSKGFRSPTIQELYIWNHNSDLSPEKIWNYETGIQQLLFKQNVDLDLTCFAIYGNNQIITVPLRGLENAGKIFNKGIEFSANIKTIKNAEIAITYSYIDMRTPVYAAPKHHLFTSFRYNINKISVMTNVQYINHLDTDPGTKSSFQEYLLLDSKLTFQIWKYAEVFISGENLLNQKYETVKYYSMPGTTAFGGLSIKI